MVYNERSSPNAGHCQLFEFHDCANPVFEITMIMMAVYNYFSQSSYLSQISQIIFVEKKLSCREILGDFATIYALSVEKKLSPKSTFVEKK